MEHGWRRRVVWCSLCFVAAGCSGESSLRSDGTNDAGVPNSGGSSGTSSGGTSSGGTSSGGTSSGGTSSGGTSNGGTSSGGASNDLGCGGYYSMSVNVQAATGATEYNDLVVARIRDIEGQRELEVYGEISDEGGTVSTIRLVVAPYADAGTYTCSSGSATITTVQQCCPNEYDTRNMPIDECTIAVAGLGDRGQTVVGTFEGIPHDENGGRMVLRDGRFCVLL